MFTITETIAISWVMLAVGVGIGTGGFWLAARGLHWIIRWDRD